MDALALKLTSFSHSGGCGCKIDPTALHQILEKVPKHWAQPDLLVGIENNDDAAVMRISEHESLIFSSDFSTPIVDDPYTYGRIAAANALSDIYAMGADPLIANALVGFPVNKLPMDSMQEIMHGAVDVCKDANIPLAGGHSIDNPQPIFGLAVIGRMHTHMVKTNSGARPGDMLILTKPLGIGILASAIKSPLELERTNAHNWHGSCHAGDHDLAQSGAFRPVYGWAQHRMPIEGLYQTGATTNPGPSVSAGPGRNAAWVMLDDFGIDRRKVFADVSD